MMADQPDDRIALRFGPLEAAGPGDAVLLEGPAALPEGVRAVARFASGAGHGIGCRCCGGGRAAAALALAALFQDRARGRVPWFTRVLAVVRDEAAVAEALQADRVAAARFRVER